MRKLQVGLFFVLMTLMVVSCNKKQENAEVKNVEEKPKIKVEQVEAQDVEQLYEYTAIVQAEAVNNIAPTIAGRIEKIFVEVGDRVKQGQKLVQMDASNLTQTKTQLDNLEVNFKRIDELYKVGGVSKAEWDALSRWH